MNKISDNVAVVDIESNGLLYEATVIHCIVIKMPDGKILKFWDGGILFSSHIREGSIDSALLEIIELINSGTILVGHNVCGYDWPLLMRTRGSKVLSKILDPTVGSMNTYDTFIIDCLLNPERLHSLDHHARMMGMVKPPHDDWTKLSGKMLTRCEEDVKINAKLWEKQKVRLDAYPEWLKAIELEQKVSFIHSQQVLHGVRLDVLKAVKIISHLDERIETVKKTLHSSLPPTVSRWGTELDEPFKKDGTLKKSVIDWFTKELTIAVTTYEYPIATSTAKDGRKAVRIGGGFSRIDIEPLNLNSHPKVKEVLLDLGWEPTEWNFKKDKSGGVVRDSRGQPIKTSPKLTEDSYSSLPPGLGSDLTLYLMLCHRRRFLLNENDTTRGALSFVRRDGYVPSEAFTCGTPTSRYRHTGALVNMPNAGTIYGKELRSIFTVPKGNQMLGIDLKGIEARLMGHYAHFYDGGEYAKVVLEKDVHEVNAKILGVTRDIAKRFLYAISYGAGVAKLASILGVSNKVAKQLIEKYWKVNKGLTDLKEALADELMRNGHWVKGLDGRKLYVRAEHKILNALIQTAGAIVFKRWMVECYAYQQASIGSLGEHYQILAMHDELAWDVYSSSRGQAERIGDVIVKLIELTGRSLRLNVPLTGDVKIGKTYTEVH